MLRIFVSTKLWSKKLNYRYYSHKIIKRILKRIVFLPNNLIIDHLIKSVSFNNLNMSRIERSYFNINKEGYERWVQQYFPKWVNQFGYLMHKKLLEFFTTFSLLDISDEDIYMDAAGGQKSYASGLTAKKIYLQDRIISQDLRFDIGNRVEYIECDAGKITLPNESIDKISCHHSFEHFQYDSDISFIKEVQRLLRLNGKCCIIPIFIANHYAELTDQLTFRKKFDSKSKIIIDPTATLPGGKSCGNYARIYSVEAFRKRVIKNINHSKFKVTIVELRMDGERVPDLTLQCHKSVTALNRPYRAMLIERFI